MSYTADRNGNDCQEMIPGRIVSLRRLYGSRTGRFLLKPLVSPAGFLKLWGKILDSRVSALAIGPVYQIKYRN